MFERFTDRARRVLVLAQEESRLLGHNYIGTEHILLGVAAEGEGVGARVLESFDLALPVLRTRVDEVAGSGSGTMPGHVPFTPRAKKALELSLREALQLGHDSIGTEHILLGLAREGEGRGAQILVGSGVRLEDVRRRVLQLLGGRPEPGAGADLGAPQRAITLRGPHENPERCVFCGRDLWEVDRYVIGDAGAICDVCVGDAYHVVRAAQSERVLRFPPRVFGDPPPESEAVAEMASALSTVFGGGPEADVSRVLEDAAQLGDVRAEARRRFPHVVEPSVRLTRVRARGPDGADVRFKIVLGGMNGPVVDGRMVEIDGRWRVSRETFCQVMRMAGVQCPPPEAQAG